MPTGQGLLGSVGSVGPCLSPGRTGVIETRLDGGYASRPESGADNVVDVLAQLVPVMNQLLNEIPLSAMNPVDHPQINLL